MSVNNGHANWVFRITKSRGFQAVIGTMKKKRIIILHLRNVFQGLNIGHNLWSEFRFNFNFELMRVAGNWLVGRNALCAQITITANCNTNCSPNCEPNRTKTNPIDINSFRSRQHNILWSVVAQNLWPANQLLPFFVISYSIYSPQPHSIYYKLYSIV